MDEKLKAVSATGENAEKDEAVSNFEFTEKILKSKLLAFGMYQRSMESYGKSNSKFRRKRSEYSEFIGIFCLPFK